MSDAASIVYAREQELDTAEFRRVLVESTLGERRPIDDPKRLAAMLAGSDLIVTARRGGELLGVARSVTDFVYCCYLSDLAVARSAQRSGIGRGLIDETSRHLGPKAFIVLLAAPAAEEYYAKVGFEPHPSAWVRHPRS